LSSLRKNRCPAIPVGLEQNVDDVAVLIDGPPEVLTLGGTLASKGEQQADEG
jgi:hypothetical protein